MVGEWLDRAEQPKRWLEGGGWGLIGGEMARKERKIEQLKNTASSHRPD